MAFFNRRVDPRLPDVVEWGEQITEGATVAEFAELPGRYGIRITQIFNTDAVVAEIADDEYSAFTPLAQITSGIPSASEFYADGGSAYIFVHASNVGKYVRTDIYPGGTVITAERLGAGEFRGPQGIQGEQGPPGSYSTLDDLPNGITYKKITAVEQAKLSGIATGADVTSAQTTLIWLPGMYMQFAGAAAPTGWLACDGAAVSRSTYAALFAIIGTTYGAGNGTTTFNLPDACGLVMVGAGAHGTMTRADASAYDGGAVGATRNDQMQGHKHSLSPATTPSTYSEGEAGSGNVARISTAQEVGDPTTDGTNGTPRTGNETRPAEIAVLVCIKY